MACVCHRLQCNNPKFTNHKFPLNCLNTTLAPAVYLSTKYIISSPPCYPDVPALVVKVEMVREQWP